MHLHRVWMVSESLSERHFSSPCPLPSPSSWPGFRFYLKNSHPWVNHRSIWGKCAGGEQGRGGSAPAPRAPASDPWEPAVAAGDPLRSQCLCSWNSAWHHSEERNSLIPSYKKLFVIIFFSSVRNIVGAHLPPPPPPASVASAGSFARTSPRFRRFFPGTKKLSCPLSPPTCPHTYAVHSPF